MFNIGGSEMVVLAILALLVFGPESLPGIIKNVMRTINAVKTAARDFQTEVNSALQEENERKDLASRQRKPFIEEAAVGESPSQDVPPQPDESPVVEETSERAEPADPPGLEEPEPVEMEAESEPELESPDVEEPSTEESVDDDGPRVAMGHLRRVVPEEVTEAT